MKITFASGQGVINLRIKFCSALMSIIKDYQLALLYKRNRVSPYLFPCYTSDIKR